TSITIPEGITTIKSSAFDRCNQLTSINIPASISHIEEWAFINCQNLCEFRSIHASPDQRCLIMDGALVAFAPAGIFDYTIPYGVTKIERSAFRNCQNLSHITIPEDVTEIGNSAFSGCYNLSSITIPEGITSIDDYALYDCSSLISINLPESVRSIGKLAFYECNNLTSVYCKATTPPTVGNNIFDTPTSGRKIFVPAASVEAYKTAEGWSDYDSAIVGYDF
ncbi:MAG: leucine-rich repeat domain-containing protein, partial [Rikenellaceae bacterium]|nr:leucine-rich repeat domain-containing protein [Rikenellaceae bacterium]